MQKRASFGLSVLVGALTIGLSGTAANAAPQDAELVKKGQQLYAAQKCATCHSIAGQGAKSPKGSTLDGVGTKLSADEIRQWIVDPAGMTKKTKSTKKPVMPSKYSKLPAGEVDALVAYMQSLK
jgi:mono/diheme cytochrome c family protein